MVFNPNSRESCEYYGVPFTKDEISSYSNRGLFARPSTPDYYPDQSRDYALSNTVKCNMTICAVNKNGYCEVPSLIQIDSQGRCETGLKFKEVRK